MTSTSAAAVALPAIDSAAADRTRAALAAPPVASWLASTRSVAGGATACPVSYGLLQADTFDEVASLVDPVLAELLLNLDAALGAAGEWCRRGDAAAATVELDDAHRIVAVVDQRLKEIGAP